MELCGRITPLRGLSVGLEGGAETLAKRTIEALVGELKKLGGCALIINVTKS